MGRRTSITPLSIKMAVYQRDDFRCRYCGVRTSINPRHKNGPRGRSVDHVVPASRGGRNNIVNLVTACRGCNMRKLNLTLREAGMTMLPRPVLDPTKVWRFNKKRANTVCVNCGLGSKRSHLPSEYHGGPRKCRKGDTYYFAQCHLDYLQSQGVH